MRPRYLRGLPCLAVVCIILLVLASPSSSSFPSPGECVKMGGFVCSNDSLCLQPSVACNGQLDCSDGSDEDPAFCASYNCSEGGYNRVKCPGDDRRCVAESSFCDGVKDCLDGTDEDKAMCKNYNCSAVEKVNCPSLIGCVDPFLLCDGKAQCLDGSDESRLFCRHYNCSANGMSTCPSGTGCLQDLNSICDGVADCVDGSDEANSTCGSSSSFNCSDTLRESCPSGIGCLASSLMICDGQSDCRDKSDESKAFCSTFDCAADGRIKCPSGAGCLNGEVNLCNGVSECTDGSDESASLCNSSFDCSTTGRALCPSGKMCTGIDSFCQLGTPTCSDGSDQDPSFCRNYTCSRGFSKCGDGVTCLSHASFCDGIRHCPDGSDEDPSTCHGFNCTATNRFPCPSGNYCMANSCDICTLIGHNYSFCPDGSDQSGQYCDMRPSNDTCSSRCDPRSGPCLPLDPSPNPFPNPPMPAPSASGPLPLPLPRSFPAEAPAPSSGPPPPFSKDRLNNAIRKLDKAVHVFRAKYLLAKLQGNVTDYAWRVAARAARNTRNALWEGPIAVASGKLSGYLYNLRDALPNIPGLGEGEKIGKEWRRTIKSLMKAVDVAIPLIEQSLLEGGGGTSG